MNEAGSLYSSVNEQAVSLHTRLDIGSELDWNPQHLAESAWFEHVPFAFWIVKALRPRAVVELGTHLGVSYAALCQAVERLQLPTRCYAVDTWVGDHQAGEYGPDVFATVNALNEAHWSGFSTLLRTTFDEARGRFGANEVDLLHIDGLHTYEAVRRDFKSWRDTLSDRGVVLFHDTNVRRDDFGVWRLWQEVSAEHPHFEFLHGFGLGVLGVGGALPAPVQALFAAARDATATAQIRAMFAARGRAVQERHQLRRTAGQLAQSEERNGVMAAAARTHAALAAEHAEVLDRQAALQAELTAATTDNQALRHETQALQDANTALRGARDAAMRAHRVAAGKLAAEGSFAAALQQALDREAVLAGDCRALREEHAALEQRITELARSSSWRITRPIRVAKRLMTGDAATRDRLRGAFSSIRGGALPSTPPLPVHRTVEAFLGFLRRRPALKRALQPYIRPTLRLLQPSPAWTAPAAFANYARWVELHDTLSEADRAAIRAHIATLPPRPLISVVMPAYNTPEPFLRAAIASVQAQLWPHWELCVADDASPSPHVAAVLAEAAAADPRIRWSRRPANGHISAASNTALGLARGEWVALMDHDDVLPEHALYEIAVEAGTHPGAQVIYSDEDKLDAEGRRYDPYFKPDFDPDLLLGQNLVSHLGAYRRALLERIGGFREGFEGSQDHDLVLRASAAAGAAAIRHIPAVLYHWRQGTGSASFSDQQMARCVAASRAAVADHLAARGLAGEVVAAPAAPMHNRVVWPLPEPAPLVSVIVPTKDRADLLETCLDGLLARTDYPAIEVLVADNGSTEPATLALFERLSADPRVRILPLPGPFNYSRVNNQGAAQARGSVLLLLNNDVQVIDGGWLREMVSQALRLEVGAVGCKLTYADGTLQHGGTILGAGGVASHYLNDAAPGDHGPFNVLALARCASAVTAACLALRREVFEAVGGLDEDGLAVAFNDVDLCIRIRDGGWRIVWTPFAELHHLESASRGDDLTGERAIRFQGEVAVMQQRWGEALTTDPYWNPNLSLVNAQRDLADPPRRIKPWHAAAAGGLLADADGPV